MVHFCSILIHFFKDNVLKLVTLHLLENSCLYANFLILESTGLNRGSSFISRRGGKISSPRAGDFTPKETTKKEDLAVAQHT